MDGLRNIKLFIPSRAVQEKVVAHIDAQSIETQRLASIYRKKLEALELFKKSLLHKALSGELTAPPSQAIKEAAE